MIDQAIDTPCNSETVERESSELPVVRPQQALTDISKISNVDELKASIGAVLKQFEDGRTERPVGVRRIDETWAQCVKIEDTNQHVLMVLNQCLVLFQNAYDEFLTGKAKGETYLQELAVKYSDALANNRKKDYEPAAILLEQERKRIERKSMADQANLREFAKCVNGLAHEYRQCKTSQAYYVHVSQLQQFVGVVIAVLHSKIHDAALMKEIADAIGGACLKIFPIELNQSDGEHK